MTRVSILFLKQPDAPSDSSCLSVELKGFLTKPRFYDDIYARDFGPTGYEGPALMQDHDASGGDLEGSIAKLLHPQRNDAFPGHMVQHLTVGDDCQIPQYTSHDSDDIWSIIKYRGGHGSLEKTQSWLDDDRGLDLTKTLRRQSRLFRSNTRVATWICTDTSVFIPDRRLRLKNLIVLMFEKQARSRNSDTYAGVLQDLFNREHGLADAIEDHPMLIYLYMHFCFNDFNNILKCYERLFKLSNTITGRTTWGVSDRSFLLNQALIQISFSLPDILQNRALLKRLREYNEIEPFRTRGTGASQGLRDAMKQAKKTLLSIEDDVADFERQVEMFLERFKASLELEFSVADERMSWVMMWFTFVAIIFTPMAFVASIFGMTSLEADPRLFVAAVIPVLLASITLCYYIFTKSQHLDEGLRPKRLHALLHLMPYSQITSLRRRKGQDDGRTKASRKSKQSRRYNQRLPDSSGSSDSDDSSDGPSPLHYSQKPSGRPPIFVSVPPPPAPSFPPPPGLHGHGRPPGMPIPPFPVPPAPRPPGATFSARPSMATKPVFVTQVRPSSKPHRMSSSHPMHHQKPISTKEKKESSTTYSNLRMPDFSSRASRRPSRPPQPPQAFEETYRPERYGSGDEKTDGEQSA
ncbi:hypothetical protein B0T10DRAFT_550604 [Thelonectria olida]|uniref:Uncharacterized protein n=1 Tax=Thelonectria olida TaxID=1576542 RepID=A0A9P9ALV3_9HYPO|nr:hypothetical protein B0T10DRAFT_550604 [Thelonectria olida]